MPTGRFEDLPPDVQKHVMRQREETEAALAPFLEQARLTHEEARQELQKYADDKRPTNEIEDQAAGA